MSDPLTHLLAELPLAESDPAWEERIKIACRARLARQAERAATSYDPPPRTRTIQVWLPLTVVLAAAYLSQVLVQALQVSR